MKDEMEVVLRRSQDVPIDIFGLIEELGIVYLEQPMGAGLSGRIDYNEPFCTITVNSEESYQRRRFTAAHELGHYLLHRDLMDGKQHLDRLFANGGRDNPVAPLSPLHEVQANRFAADLLMPINVLRDRYDPIRDNVEELARLFEVSQAAMKIRLKAIGVRLED
ncbi:MAG: ImmA/IrrE family metallo-endopeptidase [Paracoccaceae bacterium]